MNLEDVKVGVIVRAPSISIRNPSRLYRVVKARPTRHSELAVDLEAVSPPTIKKPLARIHWQHLVLADASLPADGHRFNASGYHTDRCLYCGKPEDGADKNCVPRLDAVPEGLLTTRDAHVKLGVSHATFVSRYQYRGLYPAALFGVQCTYLWDEATLAQIAKRNVEWGVR
jgi:hypothetical protein